MKYKQLYPDSFTHKVVTSANIIDMYLTVWGCFTKVKAYKRPWWSV